MPITLDGTTGISTPGVVNSGSETIGGTLGVTGAVTLSTTLGVAQGGTGATALTSGSVLIGAGTSAVSLVAAGSNGNVLTSNGTTWTSATPANLGVGQTWQNLTASRAIGTTYTNSTGRSIVVCPTVSSTVASGGAMRFFIDGVNVCNQGATQNASIATQASVAMVIPAGSTYSITNFISGSANIAINTWFELR